MSHLFQPKKIILLILIAAVTLGASLFIRNKLTSKEKVHYHAGFVVFQNDQKLDFSQEKFMYTKPCVLNENENESNTDEQMEKAHLHDNVGDVLHIESSGAVWADLFSNIQFSVSGKNVTGYINGRKVDNFQQQSINPNDSLVVLIANNNIDKSLKQAVTKEYIEKMAKKSKTCGD